VNALWLLGMAAIVFGAFGLCALVTVPGLHLPDEEPEEEPHDLGVVLRWESSSDRRDFATREDGGQ
jgi:hypothetical protein